ncbi:hypothetical protein KKD03_05495 [Patescibacteria group bacterium]|nr:hypothetical protein [Patescibacteria group bacterium]
MNNYNNNNKFQKPQQDGQRSDHRGSDNRGSNRRNSDRPRFGSQNSGPTQMHDAVCADCGGNCKVPFMPSSGKPVYCSNCFEKRGNGGNNKRSFSPHKGSFSPPATRPRENYNKQFEIINSKLDKIFKLLTPRDKVKEVKKVKKVNCEAREASLDQEVKEVKVVAKEVVIEKTASTEKITEKVAPTKVAKKKAKTKKALKAKISKPIN